MEQLRALSTALADAVERVAPAVVQVRSGPRRAATGTVFAEDRILMADHALEQEEDLIVRTDDGRKLPAQVAGRDPATDLAVLTVPTLHIPPPTLLQGSPRVGEVVISVGRSWGGGLVAGAGIVSAVGRSLRMSRGRTVEEVLRTSVTPYPGFSGGPLVDVEGHVLGLATAGLSRGAGLAIPVSVAWSIGEHLAEHGRLKRGYLGISGQRVFIPEAQRAELTQEHGLLVIGLAAQSPAAMAGLLVGDIVVSFDRKPVRDTEELLDLLTAERVGQTIGIGTVRGTEAIERQLTVGERAAAH